MIKFYFYFHYKRESFNVEIKFLIVIEFNLDIYIKYNLFIFIYENEIYKMIYITIIPCLNAFLIIIIIRWQKKKKYLGKKINRKDKWRKCIF